MQNFILTPISLDELEARYSAILDKKLEKHLACLQQSQTNNLKNLRSRKEAAQKLGVSLVTLNEWT